MFGAVVEQTVRETDRNYRCELQVVPLRRHSKGVDIRKAVRRIVPVQRLVARIDAARAERARAARPWQDLIEQLEIEFPERAEYLSHSQFERRCRIKQHGPTQTDT